jgi:hypothetical protein
VPIHVLSSLTFPGPSDAGKSLIKYLIKFKQGIIKPLSGKSEKVTGFKGIFSEKII